MKRGRPPKKECEKLRGYRYNLNLDSDLKDYLSDIAWKNRTSITQYLNDLIRADRENHYRMERKQATIPDIILEYESLQILVRLCEENKIDLNSFKLEDVAEVVGFIVEARKDKVSKHEKSR